MKETGIVEQYINEYLIKICIKIDKKKRQGVLFRKTDLKLDRTKH